MEPGDPTSVRLEKFPSNATALKTDADGNILDAGDDAYKVKVNDEDASAGFLSDKLADTLDVEFNPTVDNSKMESIVYQLTGKGAALASRDVQGLMHANGPGIAGFTYGRGCAPGYIYKKDLTTNTMVRQSAWLAQSSDGSIFSSVDKFVSAIKDSSLALNSIYTSEAGYGAQCIHYGKISIADTNYSWIVFKQSYRGFFYVPDVEASYNDDGTFKSSAWVKVANSNISDTIAHAVSTKEGGLLLTAAHMNGVTYYTDLSSTGSVKSLGEEISGIATDSYGTYLVVARNSGKIYRNNSEVSGSFNNASWAAITNLDGFTVNGVPADNFPITGSGGGLSQTWWAGLGCAYGLWVCTVARKQATTDPVYAYSSDGVNWITYGGTADDQLITVWDMKSDGAFWFGCPVGTSTPLVYQLLVNSIPSRKRFIAEKGLVVVDDAFLQDLPSAELLGTDENGKFISKAGTETIIGNAPKEDYVFSPFTWADRKWIPNGKASGVVEALLGDIVRDDVAHTITIPAYTVQLFDNVDYLGQPLRYSVAAATFTLTTTNTRQFVIAKYIAPGVAQTVLTPFIEDLNMATAVPLFSVERVVYADSSSKIHAIGFDTLGEGLAQKIETRLMNTTPYIRSTSGGLMISSTALKVALTSATVFAGTTPINVLAYDSNVDNLIHVYPVAGTWTYSNEPTGTFNNSQYNGGADLTALPANKYKNIWLYRSIGDDKEMFYVDGTSYYNSESSALAEISPSVPSLISWHCMLVGRIVIQNGATSGYIVQSPFTNQFASGGIDDHKVLGSDSDTVPATLIHKIVDSTGAELDTSTNGVHGTALVIPSLVIAGSPNGQQLFDYSIHETTNTIAQDGSASGNSSGNRGFAFICNASRKYKKGRIFISQTGGNYLRMGIYDDSWNLLGKSARISMASGIIVCPFTLDKNNNAIDGINLVGGNSYYLAYWVDDTAGNVRFGCLSGRNISSAAPLSQIYDVNDEMPSSLGTSGSPTAYRPWMMISE